MVVTSDVETLAMVMSDGCDIRPCCGLHSSCIVEGDRSGLAGTRTSSCGDDRSLTIDVSEDTFHERGRVDSPHATAIRLRWEFALGLLLFCDLDEPCCSE